MRVLVDGSGGAGGWPAPGCRCASCLRKETDGPARKGSTIVVDDIVRLGVGDGGSAGDGSGGAGGTGAGFPRGYLIRQLADARDQGKPGGWEVTGPDGERLLYPAGPGSVPVPPQGAAGYDIVFLDLLGEPAQLGLLRARGLVTTGTVTAVAFADHRVATEGELRRRCAWWRAELPGDGDTVTTVRSEEKNWRRTRRVLVLGGARSGKSERAELRLAGEADVTYVATGPGGSATDPEWAARVAAHRARRPGWWRTAETTDLAGVLAGARGALLIDGIGTWLAAVMDECGAWDAAERRGAGPGGAERRGDGAARGDGAERLAGRIAGLVGAWRQTGACVVAVSDEAGMGVVPATPAGRLYRDELGRLNQLLAAESEEAELVVAGRVIPLGAG